MTVYIVLLEFGDGSTANTAQLFMLCKGRYYTVELTVADPSGNKQQIQPGFGICRTADRNSGSKVIDGSTAALYRCKCICRLPDDTPKQYTTNGAGVTCVFAVAGTIMFQHIRPVTCHMKSTLQ
jgi:hypothetical protein